jgi:hypothetical protein
MNSCTAVHSAHVNLSSTAPEDFIDQKLSPSAFTAPPAFQFPNKSSPVLKFFQITRAFFAGKFYRIDLKANCRTARFTDLPPFKLRSHSVYFERAAD